jgi:hypothetical protein
MPCRHGQAALATSAFPQIESCKISLHLQEPLLHFVNKYQIRSLGSSQTVIAEAAAMFKKKKKLHGTVQKIISPVRPNEPEKAQITVEEADPLYRELRVENVVTNESGQTARLKPQAEVEVIIEADADATT